MVRGEHARGALQSVRVLENDVEIGMVGGDEYLCWDRAAGARGVGRAFYEGVGRTVGTDEAVFDLPRDGGSTTYFEIRIQRDDRKPVIEKLTAEAGRALVAKRTAAAQR